MLKSTNSQLTSYILSFGFTARRSQLFGVSESDQLVCAVQQGVDQREDFDDNAMCGQQLIRFSIRFIVFFVFQTQDEQIRFKKKN